MGTRQVQLWTLPFRRNPFFTGRDERLEYIHYYLQTQQTAFGSQPAALCGLGGVGKTQIVIEYAYRYAQEYQYIFWLRADTYDTLANDFVTLAHLLQLPEAKAQDQSISIETVKHWLSEQNGWLLLFDNADDLSLADPFLPMPALGHILFTTRTHTTGRRAQRVDIADMSLTEGTRFLLRRIDILAPNAPLSAVSEAVSTAATTLVDELHGFPLALDQAGAYIEETGCSLSHYLELYHTQRQALLARRSKEPSEHPEPVSTTWSISFERIEQANPAAAELLRCCAFLHPDAIPEELFTKGTPHFNPVLQEATRHSLQFDKAISDLLNYSLLRRLPKTGGLSMHPLVQAILKDAMDLSAQKQWASCILQVIAQLFPFSQVATWETCQRYLPHAMLCANSIEQWDIVSETAAGLLHNVASYLKDRAQFQESEGLHQRALAIRERILGPKHPDIADTLYNLAILYSDQGKHEQAEPLYRRALKIRERALGPKHPDTVITLYNLALLYYNLGKYEQAEPLYQRTLKIRERVLGPEHPDTVDTLYNLALLYDDQGSYEQAQLLYQRTLKIRERMLGLEHPDTIEVLESYADLLRKVKQDQEVTTHQAQIETRKENHQD